MYISHSFKIETVFSINFKCIVDKILISQEYKLDNIQFSKVHFTKFDVNLLESPINLREYNGNLSGLNV